jgi:nickel superoxide dismutase
MMNTLKKTILLAFMAIALSTFIMSSQVMAHCQVPCGIYDDNARVMSMLEDAATINKAVKLIAQLAGKVDAQSQNQLIRWVITKEQHAQNIIDKISDYFLTQRVKSDQKDYTERLSKHHAVIVAAMKAKQNADKKYVINLQKSIEALLVYYPKK